MNQKNKRGLRDFRERSAFAAGFFLCAAAVIYPLPANYLYEHMQSGVIAEYEESVSQTGKSEVDKEIKACMTYNEILRERQKTGVFTVSFSFNEEIIYEARLAGTDGIMGFLEIPDIEVYLPIYHGVSDDVLEKGLGHIPETSLPVGGSGTHAVITGHTGMPGKRLFSDLPDLQIGDIFVMHVLSEKLYYKVDQIKTVLPYETDDLLVEDGMDYITLVTCTPFGINSHRLLVRGVRTDEPEYESEAELNGNQSGGIKGGISTWMKHYLASITTAALASGTGIILLCWLSRWKKRNRPGAIRYHRGQKTF